jgi:hypothetical protein
MSKYEKLARHLEALNADEWAATFSEVEAILKSPLPGSARKYSAWWSNQAGEGHAQSGAWQDAGWRTANVDLGKERVTFIRDSRRKYKSGPAPATATAPKGGSGIAGGTKNMGLTIAEAKSGLATYFGISPDCIEITIKG